jgi:hypothetical protein
MTEQFKEEWIKYCSDQINFIKKNYLVDFIINLRKPLGFGFDNSKHDDPIHE